MDFSYKNDFYVHSLDSETYYYFLTGTTFDIFDIFIGESFYYALVGLANNRVFTELKFESNLQINKIIDVAPSIPINTPSDLWDYTVNYRVSPWLACVLPNGDVYAFYFNLTDEIFGADQIHLFKNQDTSTPLSISLGSVLPYYAYILVSSVSVSGQKYADKIKILKLIKEEESPFTFVEKEISTNTIGPVIVFHNFQSILIGSTRHYESESPSLGSAQIFKMDEDLNASEFSPPSAIQVDTALTFVYSNLDSLIVNRKVDDPDEILPYFSDSTPLDPNYYDSDSVLIADQIKLTEDGFQTIQLTFELDSAYSFGASTSSNPKYLSHFVKQCQGVTWEIIEAKVGGADVPWVSTRTPNTFFIDPSLATGAGVCWGIEHTLNLKFELDTLGKYFSELLYPFNLIVMSC